MSVVMSKVVKYSVIPNILQQIKICTFNSFSYLYGCNAEQKIFLDSFFGETACLHIAHLSFLN